MSSTHATDLAGRRVPEVTFMARRDGDWKRITTADVFAGKRVVVFSLPGAFTPTCSSTHLPRYEELAGVFKANGIDDVVCVSVNDGFVMEAWGRDQGVAHVTLLPDGNGAFTAGLDMLVDKSAIGFGKRSWRYSMLVEDGVVTKSFVEPDEPGDPFVRSDADTMLKHLGIERALPAEVTVFAKPGCPFCIEARRMLEEAGFDYEEVTLSGPVSYRTLRAVTGRDTAPQIYIDGEHIDGLDGLKDWLSRR
jgi:glutaredoxin-like protein